MGLKITILCDNHVGRKGMLAEHGFCALIEVNNSMYLFDTGESGFAVVKNAQNMNIDLRMIDCIILSHGHYDHANGLEEVLRYTGSKKVISSSLIFQDRYSIIDSQKRYNGIKFKKEYLELTLYANFNYINNFSEINNKVYCSGLVPMNNEYEILNDGFKIKDYKGNFIKDEFEDENSLIINTDKGLVVVTGCAHRGIVNIMQYAKSKLKKRIYAIIGGLHLIGCTDEHFNFLCNYLEAEGVDFIYPSHCTGFNQICKMKSKFHNKVRTAFCGDIVYIN